MAEEGRGGKLILWIGVIAVIVVAWVLLRGEDEPEAPPGRPPYVLPVTLADVQSGDLAPRGRLTGTVRSLERSRLAFETGGMLVELGVREGDRIAAGQRVARLESTELELAVRRAEADLSLAQREMEKLEAGERSEERARLLAERDAAKAEAELAELEVARGRKLVAERILSESELDQLVSRRDAAVGRAASAEQRHLAAEAGTREEDLAIQSARIAVAHAALELARRQLAKTDLRAPWDGAVVARLASVGEHLNLGEDVLEVVDLSRLEVEVEVPESLAARLGDRPRAVIRVDERPGLEIEAVLDARVPVADEVSRNVRGLIRLAAGDAAALAPGEFVRVELTLQPVRDALIVPSDAVRIVEGETVVVRASAPPAPAGEPGEAPEAAGGGGAGAGPPGGPPGGGLLAEWVPVRVLGADAGETAVLPLSGTLAAGDQVVVVGVDLAFPGAPLLPRSPDAASGSAGAAGAPEAAAGDAAEAAEGEPATEAEGSVEASR